ncbi:hypothetical protein [Microvirga thermotolerans]|uniref:Uncharacterized protein n=1 Tax=Microvirga thermotolerans TaxID=2651334 RepID=A0A5P9JTQ8_9HYPH|nr:hypothetical protein [Microvirga thermotolerans]QFU16007.1 hypothetical protein GDR74_07090 [Microvirga thermotolerans]
MRKAPKTVVCLSLALAVAWPAAAQTRLPRKSPAERRVQEINRDLQQQQRLQRFEQQNQFETNQLRQSIDRQRTFGNPTPPAGIRTCPAGSVGC